MRNRQELWRQFISEAPWSAQIINVLHAFYCVVSVPVLGILTIFAFKSLTITWENGGIIVINTGKLPGLLFPEYAVALVPYESYVFPVIFCVWVTAFIVLDRLLKRTFVQWMKSGGIHP